MVDWTQIGIILLLILLFILLSSQSVVDYLIVPHDCIPHCWHINVQITNTVIGNYNLSHLISE